MAYIGIELIVFPNHALLIFSQFSMTGFLIEEFAQWWLGYLDFHSLESRAMNVSIVNLIHLPYTS